MISKYENTIVELEKKQKEIIAKWEEYEKQEFGNKYDRIAK